MSKIQGRDVRIRKGQIGVPLQGTEAGFTLVELLVSFVLLGFIMALLYGGFSFAIRAFERTSSASAHVDDVVQVQQLLRDLIGQAYPDPAAFQGNRDRLEFLAPVTRQGREDGLYRVVLGMEVGPGGQRLSLMLNPYRETLAQENGAKKVVLLEHVTDVEFSYFIKDKSNQGGAWLSLWEAGQGLPDLFKLTLKQEKGLNNGWPTLIIPFHITQNVDCRYDAVSRNCI